MGLDNGILISGRDAKKVSGLYANIDVYDDNLYEICYWRKCWGIRNEIVGYIGFCDDDYEAELTIDDLREIKNILIPFLDKDYWEDNGESLWDYYDYVDNQREQIERLDMLIVFLENNPNTEIKIIFYDSY